MEIYEQSRTEAQLNTGISEYLQYQMNLGKLWFTRLNSGQAFVKRGDKDYAIKLCEEGTSDFIVVKKEFIKQLGRGGFSHIRVIFLETKSPKGGGQSKEQKDFEKQVIELGAEYSVIRSLTELIALLD